MFKFLGLLWICSLYKSKYIIIIIIIVVVVVVVVVIIIIIIIIMLNCEVTPLSRHHFRRGTKGG